MRALYILIAVLALSVMLPLTAVGVATLATRSQGIFFAQQSATTLLPSPSPLPGFYNLNNALQACGGRSDAGSQTCYPLASPVPSPTATSFDAGTTLGSGAATKVDTCSTGGSGSTCYRMKDIVGALKTTGQLSP